ncbi:MAG TPA: glycine cleavage system aminomethyltransferase GcvT [Candidatus Bathyarchaeia archaeon]|nr:glycine cleavage system aminomethyltransferase GcvT [Candidatus Bathyarchaeia archaeon]
MSKVERLASKSPVQTTNLHDRHLALGAHMATFGDWEMPIWYTSILREHQAVRTAAGLFDICHMGQVVVEGPEALPYLQRVMTRDLSGLEVGEAKYSLVCKAKGGTVDDVFVYRLADEEYFVVVNAGTRQTDLDWLQDQKERGPYRQVKIEDISGGRSALALQGPNAEAVLQPLTGFNLASLERHHIVEIDIDGQMALVARTGYTGEKGLEIFFEGDAGKLWDEILANGAVPVGLGARDSLRLEAGMPLYGHELGPDINPIQAGLGWAVGFKKDHFIGRDALIRIKHEGCPIVLVGLQMVGKGIARSNYPVSVSDCMVGMVTSGMLSPTLNRAIALAYVERGYSKIGTQVEVTIHDQLRTAAVVKKPFYERE